MTRRPRRDELPHAARPRRRAALLGAALFAMSSFAAHARAERVPNARVLATSGVDGHLGVPICDGSRDLVPHPRSLYTYALVRQAHAEDDPLVLDAGGLLGQGGVVRFSAEHDPDALATLVAALGYDALAFGASELATPRARMLTLARAVTARGVPFVASNLRCTDPRSAPLCDVLRDASDPPLLVRAGRLELAVLAMTPPERLARLDPSERRGLELSSIPETLADQVERARSSADAVVLVLDTSRANALALLDVLDERARPDLVILSDPEDRELMGRPTYVTPAIVTPPRADAVEVGIRSDETVRLGVYEMIAQPLGQRGLSAGDPLLAFLDHIGSTYCEEWGQTLPGGRLARAIDRADLTMLVADFARESVDADVAVINRSLFDSTFRPAHDAQLTASDLFVGIEHDEELYEAWVPSDWLLQVAATREGAQLATPGLGGAGDGARLRGRPLVARASYHVVTTRYLALGTRAPLPALPAGSRWSPLRVSSLTRFRRATDRGFDEDPPLTIRELALRALSRRSSTDPRDDRESADEAPEWLFRGSVDASFSGSSVENPGHYAASQLNRASTITLGAEVNLRLDATAPAWTWENLGILRYRTQWTAGAPVAGVATAGSFSEAVDQLQLRSTASYRGLRTPGASEPWVPDPYVELFVESELSEPATRSFHWLLTRPTIGARFPLTTDLELKLQTGLEAQILAPNASPLWGLGAVLTLKPWDLVRVGDRRVRFEGLVDLFYADPGRTERLQLRGSFDASLDLAGPLALSFGVRAYLEQASGASLGFALDAIAGLRLGALGRAVGP